MIESTSLAALHGYLCGDGCVIKNPPESRYTYYRVDLRNTSMTLLKDFQDKFEEVVGSRPFIPVNKERCTSSKKAHYEFFNSNFGSFYSREWSMPEMNEECTARWLRAFYDCEGWVNNRPRKSRVIGLDCVNHQGLKQINNALEQFGICSHINKRSKRDTFTINIHGKNNLKLFQETIGFLHPGKKKKLQEALDSYDYWKWDFTKMGLQNFFEKR